jgi:uncharacterized membrane protein
MAKNNEKLTLLLLKLDAIIKRQEYFSNEINELRQEINFLKLAETEPEKVFPEKQTAEDETALQAFDFDLKGETEPGINDTYPEKDSAEPPKYVAPAKTEAPKIKSDIEKFIGENVINKIGIAITVIGVAIGAKYSIEHDLISPLTRIIMGYMMGFGLLGFGVKLKKNYENYSAVLVSGAIAIMYFITYAAYSFFSLLPQSAAFGLMVVFTAFAVFTAIKYNQQVISHIGLVGAYAVPFLLSDGSGKVEILFSYMAIINIGILLISFKKYWKPLYYSSFLLTWIIFVSWYGTKYLANLHYGLSLAFISVFFATFYAIFLAYKLIKKEKFDIEDIALLLFNSFLFYGLGYSILSTSNSGEEYLGLFTLINAAVHFGVALLLYTQKLADRNLFYLVSGLVLVFVTIAIPVQLDGNWVTLLWSGEAALMFWIGRTKNAPLYEKLSYPMMLIAFFSIVHDWLTRYDYYNSDFFSTGFTPVFNINFLTAILFIAFFVFINYLNMNKKHAPSLFPQNQLNDLIRFSIPAILLVVLYFSVRMEISTYWEQLYHDSLIQVTKPGQPMPEDTWNYDLLKFKTVWLINYSLLFFTVLSFVNIIKIRSRNLGLFTLGFNTLVMLVFLTQGLYILSELRESFLNHELPEQFINSSYNIGIRYISFVFAGLMLISCRRYVTQDFLKPLSLNLKIAFDILLYTSLVWIASSELINWMDILKFTQSYKLGLSILWGTYALLLIVLGIWKNKKHLRLCAIILFSATLLKLFLYDLSYLDTIAKTIVFVTLGVLLLIISFLYNKYKHHISEDREG